MTRGGRPDAIGWTQLLGAPALFAAFWVLFVDLRFPEIPLAVNVVVIVALVGLGFALVLIGWSRFGGYGSYRTLRRWVRGGPDPTGVPPEVRMRFLRREARPGTATGWFWIALGVLWVALAVPELLDGEPSGIGRGAIAVMWAVAGTERILFTRKWGTRVTELVRATEAELADPGATPHLDLFR